MTISPAALSADVDELLAGLSSHIVDDLLDDWDNPCPQRQSTPNTSASAPTGLFEDWGSLAIEVERTDALLKQLGLLYKMGGVFLRISRRL